MKYTGSGKRQDNICSALKIINNSGYTVIMYMNTHIQGLEEFFSTAEPISQSEFHLFCDAVAD